MNEQSIRNLASAVMLQAVKDYFSTSKEGKQQILKDLRSAWMRDFTNGTSVNVAEQLKLHPDEIKERLRKNYFKED